MTNQKDEIAQLHTLLLQQEREIADLKHQADTLYQQLTESQKQLLLISGSKGWKWLQRAWRFKTMLTLGHSTSDSPAHSPHGTTLSSLSQTHNEDEERLLALPDRAQAVEPSPETEDDQIHRCKQPLICLEEALDAPLRQVLAQMQERIMFGTTYFGVRALKNPLDFWVYQEIISETQPDVIIEIGNYSGGSTLALAHLCDLMGKGRVIGLDLSHQSLPDVVRCHPRITLFEGDACANYEQVACVIKPGECVMIIEDSAHTYENTLAVLRTYNSLVKPGCYFIVEDGIIWHGLELGPCPGPYEAIETFLAENDAFQSDRSMEGFLITWNPKGFLLRVK